MGKPVKKTVTRTHRQQLAKAKETAREILELQNDRPEDESEVEMMDTDSTILDLAYDLAGQVIAIKEPKS